MLEFIKELMPLLEGAKNGAVWLVAAYFGLLAMKMLLISGVILTLAAWVNKALSVFWSSSRVRHNDWSTYQWDENKSGGINAFFSRDDMRELLRSVANERGYVHSSDVLDAAKIIRDAKAK